MMKKRTLGRGFALAAMIHIAAFASAAAQGDEGGSIGGRLSAPSHPNAAPVRRERRRAVREVHIVHERVIVRVPQAAPRRAQRAEQARGGRFDGVWSVSAAGDCAAAGTAQIVISDGHISGQGLSGSVSATGAVRTIGTVSGLTVVSHGRIAGASASGVYRQSDGCAGPWTGIKQ